MLILVRHGQTVNNAAGRLSGRGDVPLDDLGRRQAAAVAARLANGGESCEARVIASPLTRTRQTAAELGSNIETDDRWIELDYGDWEGRPLSRISAQTWSTWMADPTFCPPGGESLRHVSERVRAACEELSEACMHENVIVVSHVSPIKAAVGWALGVSDEVVWHLYVHPASITRISIERNRTILRTFNATDHLTVLDQVASGSSATRSTDRASTVTNDDARSTVLRNSL